MTTTSSMMFGRTCRNMMRRSPKPSARQASTKSRSFMASVEPRATRTKAGIGGDRDGEDEVEQARAEHRDEDQPHDELREAQQHVGRRRDQLVDDAAEIAGDDADRGADDDRRRASRPSRRRARRARPRSRARARRGRRRRCRTSVRAGRRLELHEHVLLVGIVRARSTARGARPATIATTSTTPIASPPERVARCQADGRGERRRGGDRGDGAHAVFTRGSTRP